jgi:hypothetical protein
MPRTLWPGGAGYRKAPVSQAGDGTGDETVTDASDWRTTSLQAEITPANTSRRVLVDLVAVIYGPRSAGTHTERRVKWALFRGCTVAEGAVADGSLLCSGEMGLVLHAADAAAVDYMRPCQLHYIDSPASAAAVRYTLCLKAYDANTSAVYANSATTQNHMVLEDIE